MEIQQTSSKKYIYFMNESVFLMLLSIFESQYLLTYILTIVLDKIATIKKDYVNVSLDQFLFFLVEDQVLVILLLI